jgi:hypothetical protein
MPISEIDRLSSMNGREPDGAAIKLLKQDLNNRGMITTKHMPVSPIIQYFEMAGTVKLVSTAGIMDSTIKINNAIYRFLDDHVGFTTPILKTDLIRIITQFPEVKQVDFDFVPMHGLQSTGFDPGNLDGDMSMDLNILSDVVGPRNFQGLDKAEIEQIAQDSLLEWFGKEGSRNWKEFYLNYGKTGTGQDGVNIYDRYVFIATHITERGFWRDFYNIFKDKLGEEGVSFPMGLNVLAGNGLVYDLGYVLLQQINGNIKRYILTSMLDVNGNISNFSLGHEIAAVTMNRPRGLYEIPYNQYALEYTYA